MLSTYMSDEEDVVCTICGGTPCDWDEYGEELTKQINMMYFREKHGNIDIVLDEGGNRLSYSQMRKAMYRIFTRIKFGHLGRGVRIPVPDCVGRNIRGMYPSSDGYMGFKDEKETKTIADGNEDR